MKDLRIVRGNDFFLEVSKADIVLVRDLDGSNDEVVEQDVKLEKYTVEDVNIVSLDEERIKAVFEDKGDTLLIRCEDNLECGRYGIEVVGKYESRDMRYYQRKVFKIVEDNKSCTPCDWYNGKPLYCIGQKSKTKKATSTASAYEPGEGENSAQLVGSGSKAKGQNSHAEGQECEAIGNWSHAEGFKTMASVDCSHAEGFLTQTSGEYSHAEGSLTQTSGEHSHAEGFATHASGKNSHTEGANCFAVEKNTHAGGYFGKASGVRSFVHGAHVEANNADEVAFGRYNDSKTGEGSKDCTLFSVGCGSGSDNRQNAFEVMQNGDIYILMKSGDDTHYVKLQDLLAQIGTGTAGEVTSNADTVDGIEVTPWSGDLAPDVDVLSWFVGQVSATAEGIADAPDEDFLFYSNPYPTSQKEVTFNINESCWFIMVPDGVQIASASYTDGGITSSFSGEEIAGGFGSGIQARDITLNGTQYHLYVNRNTALVGSNASCTITLV